MADAVEAPLRRRRKRKNRVAIFRPTEPVLRISADATSERPPRATWGYCAVSGSARQYVPASNNRCADRLLICDNWLGSNEQLLVGCIEGLGFQGPQVADWLAQHAPSALTAVAEEQARERRARVTPASAAGTSSASNVWVKNPTAIRALHDLIGMLPTELTADAAPSPADDHGARKSRAEATLAGRATLALEGAFGRLHAMLIAQWTAREQHREQQLQAHLGHAGGRSAASGGGSGGGAIDTTSSGASLCLVVVRGKSLHVAHAGSCRAVVGRRFTAVAAAAAANNVKRFHGNALARHLERTGSGAGGFAPTGTVHRLKSLQAHVAVVDVAHPPHLQRSAAHALLHASTSAPAFPDLPSVLESALWYPTSSAWRGVGRGLVLRCCCTLPTHPTAASLRQAVCDSRGPRVARAA